MLAEGVNPVAENEVERDVQRTITCRVGINGVGAGG